MTSWQRALGSSLLFFLLGCPSKPAHNGLELDVQPGAVWLSYDGTAIGPLYVIGACAGQPDGPADVTSIGGNGHSLVSTPQCPGAPLVFNVTKTGTNSFHLSVQVGPLPADYEQLGVPFDPPGKTLFTMWTYDPGVTKVYGGCAGVWSPLPNAALFSQIPTPCPLAVLHSFVGLTTTRDPPTSGPIGRVVYLEMNGFVRMRRTLVSTDIEGGVFVNHPNTTDSTFGFGYVHKGQTVRDEEDVSVG